ncbi:glucan endo-1,3-beta-glucosidase-like [Typha angustifolia]|uniref:glucan endo-1,3-beta-glucosidase-like n=1 Tax=Typha angustifolia TaxID=59011 RepID=UPI003C2D19C5
MLGDNLPPPSAVVALYKKYNINKMRLFHPDSETLHALRSSGISVVLGVRNEEIISLASNIKATDNWVNSYVVPYNDVNIQYVVVGNEVIPGELGKYVAPAIEYLRHSLNNKGFGRVVLTTAVSGTALANSYRPSQTVFSPGAIADMKAVIDVLRHYGDDQHVVMANVYPYFAYAAEPQYISIEYAQFLSQQPVVRDGIFHYYNLFDAMVDSYYAAMEKVGGGMLRILASESGWPSAGNGNFTTRELAQRYNRNLIDHIARKRTPRRPNVPIDGFIFAMFNENKKPAGIEQNWGLFYPDGRPVYPLL